MHVCATLPPQAHYRDWGKMVYARSLLVLHNMAHQGRGPLEDLGLLEIPDSYVPHFWWVWGFGSAPVCAALCGWGG